MSGFKKSAFSVVDFAMRFDTEDKCREHFFQLRFPHGFVCPKCGGSSCGQIRTRGLYQCKTCRKQISATSGTVFHGTHVSLRIWIWAIYLFTIDKRGCSALQLMRELKVTYKTAWFILHRLRIAMSHRESRYMLDTFVELDDTYLGTSTHGKKRGRGTEKAKIMVAVSKSREGIPMFAKMAVMLNLRSIEVGKFALKNIAEGTHISSDNASSYKKGLAEKYFHHFKTFEPEGDELVTLHTFISNFKAFIAGTYHGAERVHLQLYLDEFCFRFNRRDYGASLFERLLTAGLECAYLGYLG
jgi:transposase-like protein